MWSLMVFLLDMPQMRNFTTAVASQSILWFFSTELPGEHAAEEYFFNVRLVQEKGFTNFVKTCTQMT